MNKILFFLLCTLPILAFGQSTTVLPTPTTSFTPQFRYYGTAADTLKQVWVFTGSKYNRWYTATEINARYGTSFKNQIDSLKLTPGTWGPINFKGTGSYQTISNINGSNISFFKTAGDYVGSLGYDESSNSVYFQFPFNSPIKMNNRVSGNVAVNNDEFVTKGQLLDSLGAVVGDFIQNQDATTQTAKFKINGAGQASQFIVGDPDAGNYALLDPGSIEINNPNGGVLLSTGGLTISNTDVSPSGGFTIEVKSDKTTMDNHSIGIEKPFEVDWLQSLKTPTVANDVVRLQDLTGTSITTGFANKDSVLKYHQSSVFKPVLLDSSLTLDVYGNSFEVGADVSTNEAWRYIFKNTFGFSTLIPNASGGTGILYAQRRQMINSPQTNNNRFKTLNMWFNQIGQQGRGVKTLNMGIYGLRAFIANSLLATAIPASDASITKTGVWTSYAGSDSSAMKATYIGGTSQQSFTAGATITATTIGNTLVIGTGITDGSHLIIDSLTAVVDGTYTKKFNGNGLINYAPQLASGVPTNTFLNYYHQAAVIVFDNLGPGSHTVVITKGGNASARIVIDYIGTLMPPATATPLIIGECPYFTPTGIATYNGLYGTQFTNGTVDTANIATIGVVKEFEAYPITIAKVNTHWNTATDVVADYIHPNPLGHKHIFNAYAQATVTFNKSLSKFNNNVGFITNIITGTGANYYGSQYLNKDVSQGTGTNRYLIITKVSNGGSIVGNIIGKRTKASSAGTNSANVYINIRQAAAASTAYWQTDAGTNATQPVLVTVTYDDGTGADTWYAIDAITSSTTASLEKAIFIGQYDALVPLTWVPAASVTALGTFASNAPQNFGNRFSIGSTGLVNVNGLTASSAVATDASKNLISVTNTGTGNNVLAVSPTITGTPSIAGYTPTSRTITTTAPLLGGGDLSANRTFSLAGLTGLGTANQILGMNAAATAYEYKAVTAGNNITLTQGVGSITIASQMQALRLTGSGTGAATTISIPHGLSGVTSASIATVVPITSAASGSFYITTDATNINIIYAVAPVTGTNNLSYNIIIKP